VWDSGSATAWLVPPAGHPLQHNFSREVPDATPPRQSCITSPSTLRFAHFFIWRCLRGLEVRPLFLEHHSRGLVSSVKRVQVLVIAGLDWCLSVATANVLLEGLLAMELRGADEHIGGRELAAEDHAQLAMDARSFCQIGLMRGYSWFYGQSVLAAACVHAARLVSKVEPAWTEALAARCRVASLNDMEFCVRELAHAYHAQRSGGEGESPRTQVRSAGT
jgi:hypothetical protein